MEFIREGQEVEVSGEAEGGFKDKWYTAKTIKISNGTSKTNVLVEYNQLKASEQGLKRYQNNVNPCHVRPLPPKQPTQLAFQYYQVVDAFHNDGWRKGRIVKGIDGELAALKMFKVHFQHPDEKIDFGAAKLRVHLDWDNGKWIDNNQYQQEKHVEEGNTSLPFHQTSVHYLKNMRVGGGSSNFGKQNKQEDSMVTSPNSATSTFSPLPALLQSHQSSEVEKKENNKNGGNRTVKRRFSEEGKIATPSPQPFLPLPLVLQPLQSSEKQKNTNSGGNMEERQTVKRRFSEERNRGASPAALQKQAMDQGFSTGTPVEVSLPDKRCRGAWFPARVLKDIKNGSFLIEHSNLKLNEAMGCLKDVVHAPHVRLPPPQNFRGKSFVVKDKVDAFCDFVWWSGVVIEALAGNHYLVKFQNQKRMRTFDRFELRCHMEWINGDWVQELRNMGIEQAQLLQVGKTALSTDVTDESLTRKRNINHTTPTSDAQRLPPNRESHKGEVSQATMGSLSLTDGSCDHPKLQVCQEKTRSGFDVDRSGNQIKVVDSSFSSPSTVRGELCSSTIQPQNNFAIASSAHSIETSGAHDINQQKGGVAGRQSKEDISEDPKLHIPCSEVNDVVHTVLTSKGADIIVTGSDVETVQALSICYGDSSCPVAIIDDRVSTDNQHTSQSITSIKASIESKECQDIVMTPLLNDHNSYEDILESEILPFMKSSPCWKHVESSEAFRLMPQKPHFQPLEKQHAFLREGEALGLMVSFANLVEKTKKVHHDELKCVLEDQLDLVSYFKPFGFNVQPIQARLDELLRVKEKEVQLDGELKQVQGKIMNDKIEEEALILDIDKCDEKLRELQKSIDEISKERELLMKKKQTTGSMIFSSLNMHNEIEKEMQRMKVMFDSNTTAPW